MRMTPARVVLLCPDDWLRVLPPVDATPDRFQVEFGGYGQAFTVDTTRLVSHGHWQFLTVDWHTSTLLALTLARARSNAHRKLNGRKPTLDTRALRIAS